ncbi:MAG: hypothetical protein AAB539_02995 [Patescibacteria group bacterium]
MDSLEKMRVLIRSSALAPIEQERFISILSSADRVALEQIVELCEADREWIEHLYRNFSAKAAAIEAGDKGGWDRILQEEEGLLKTIREAA